MNRKTGSIFTVLFLLYFVFYAVSPFSAALPHKPEDVADRLSVSAETVFPGHAFFAPLTESHSVKEQKCDQIDPFFFDMALWGILKRGMPSDDAGRTKLVVNNNCPKNFSEKVNCSVVERVSDFPIPFPEAIGSARTNCISFHINTPLVYSGLSPPLA